MPEDSELLQMLELIFEPGTFIALDLDWPESPHLRRIVGTVVESDPNKVILMPASTSAGENAEVIIPRQSITAGWWAPMGYRP